MYIIKPHTHTDSMEWIKLKNLQDQHCLDCIQRISLRSDKKNITWNKIGILKFRLTNMHIRFNRYILKSIMVIKYPFENKKLDVQVAKQNLSI
jgi:hypothetical protein